MGNSIIKGKAGSLKPAFSSFRNLSYFAVYSFLAFVLAGCSGKTETVHPVRKSITEAVYASGKIIAEDEYTVFALGNGTVIEKAVLEGDTVAAGQKIYIIKNDAQSARLEAAQSNLENTENNLSGGSGILNDLKFALQSAQVKFSNDSMQYTRLKKLLEQQATTQSIVDNAYVAYTLSGNQKKSAEEKYRSAVNDLRVAVKNAKSQVSTAQADLNNYIIRSDKKGMVYQLMKQPGEAVRPGEPVALLGKANSRIIKLAVDQQDIRKISNGQEVLLKSDVNAGQVMKATVSRIYPVMNEMDQTFRVDAVFPGTSDLPYIHSSVEANILTAEKKNVLVIPRKALINENSVRIKENGKEKNITVKTGISTLEETEITDGLSESSEVIIN